MLVCYIVGPDSPRPPRSVGAEGVVSPTTVQPGGTVSAAMSGFAGSEYVSVWLYPPKGPTSDITGGWSSGGRYTARWVAAYADPGTYFLCGQGQLTKRIACVRFAVAAGTSGVRVAPTPTAPIATGTKRPVATSSGLSTQNRTQTIGVGQSITMSSGPFDRSEIVQIWLYLPGEAAQLVGTTHPDGSGTVAGSIKTDKTGQWEICLHGVKTRRTGCTTSWVVPTALAGRTPVGTNGARLSVPTANLSRSVITAVGFTPGEEIQLWLGAGPTVSDQTVRSTTRVVADAGGAATFTAQWYFEDPMGPFAGCLVGVLSNYAACGSIRRGTSILDSSG